MKNVFYGITLLLFISACDDSSPTSLSPSDAGESDMTSAGDMGRIDAMNPDGSITVDSGMGMGVSAEPAYVEATLRPRRSLYTREENPSVEYTVFDRIGRVIPNAEVVIDVQPVGQAVVNAENELVFQEEGAGAVRVCATPDICGRASFFVDDGPPTLEIIAPGRGEILSGEREIIVRGRTDADPSIRVFVNDLPVQVDDSGGFEHRFRAEFGLNRIDVIADDGVRRPPTRSVREVIWAPEIIPIDEVDAALQRAATLRIQQRLMDSGEAPPPPDDDGVQRVSDLSGTLAAILSRSNFLGLLRDSQIADSPDFSLRIEEILPGNPDPTLILTNEGMEVFLRLEDVEFRISGQLDFQGEPVDLRGRVFLDIAGFGAIRFLVNDDGNAGFEVGGIGLALENLSSEMDDTTAQALLDTVGSLLRVTLNGVSEDLIRGLLESEVPEFISLGAESLVAPLREIEIDEPARDGLPPINLVVGLTSQEINFVRRDRFEFLLGGGVRPGRAVEQEHPIAGIPSFGSNADAIWPPEAFGALAIRLLLINAVNEVIWRQGALRIDLSDQVGGLLPQIDTVRLDARLPPLIVPAPVGSPQPLQLQLGEIDVFVGNPANPAPDHYVMSIRSGLGIAVVNNVLQTTVDERLDVRVELVAAGGDEPPLDAGFFATIAESQLGTALTENLVELLQVEIPEIELRIGAFDRIAPSIDRVMIRPVFPDQLRAGNGWLMAPAEGVIEIFPTP